MHSWGGGINIKKSNSNGPRVIIFFDCTRLDAAGTRFIVYQNLCLRIAVKLSFLYYSLLRGARDKLMVTNLVLIFFFLPL